MSFEDWLFSFHLLMAATLVGSLVMSWIVVVALYPVEAADTTLSFNRVGMVATALTVVGLVGTISLGIWLAITRAKTNWRSCYNWTQAMAVLRIHFGDRIPDNA